MSKKKVLRKVSYIYSELQEIYCNPENSEKIHNLIRIIKEWKDELEGKESPLEQAIESELRKFNIGNKQGKMFAKLFAMRTKLGIDTKFYMIDLMNDVAHMYGVKPYSIEQVWSRVIRKAPDDMYDKMVKLCCGEKPTLKCMSNYFARKYSFMA